LMANVGDLVRSRWELDVKNNDEWQYESRVYDKRHRVGIVFSVADRKTIRKKPIYWVKWTDQFLPRQSLMISTEIEVLSEKK